MIPELTALLSSVKTIRDLSISLQQIKTDDAVREKVAQLNFAIIDLQQSVMSIQAENQELVRTTSELQEKLEEAERWRDQADQYKITSLAEGVYVVLKTVSDEPDELGIPLCANCFENRKRSILQRTKHTTAGIHYKCPNCPSEIIDHSKRIVIKRPVIKSTRRMF